MCWVLPPDIVTCCRKVCIFQAVFTDSTEIGFQLHGLYSRLHNPYKEPKHQVMHINKVPQMSWKHGNSEQWEI